jgi:hypothetical protein
MTMGLSSTCDPLKGKFSDVEGKCSSIAFIFITQTYCWYIAELTVLLLGANDFNKAIFIGFKLRIKTQNLVGPFLKDK